MATIPAASARATCRHAAAMSASVTDVRGGIGSNRARCANPPSQVRWRRTWSSTGRASDADEVSQRSRCRRPAGRRLRPRRPRTRRNARGTPRRSSPKAPTPTANSDSVAAKDGAVVGAPAGRRRCARRRRDRTPARRGRRARASSPGVSVSGAASPACLQQHAGEPRDFEHGADLRRGGADHQRALDRRQPVVQLDEHPDARRADEPDARTGRGEASGGPRARSRPARHRGVGPRAVEPALDDQLEPAVRRPGVGSPSMFPTTSSACSTMAAGIVRLASRAAVEVHEQAGLASPAGTATLPAVRRASRGRPAAPPGGRRRGSRARAPARRRPCACALWNAKTGTRARRATCCDVRKRRRGEVAGNLADRVDAAADERQRRHQRPRGWCWPAPTTSSKPCLRVAASSRCAVKDRVHFGGNEQRAEAMRRRAGSAGSSASMSS